MTRKDFELIAKVLNEVNQKVRDENQSFGEMATPREVIGLTIDLFISYLKQTNPSFNAERFLRACGD